MPPLSVSTASLRLFIKPLWRRSASVNSLRRRFRLLDRLSSLWAKHPNVAREEIGRVQVEWISQATQNSRGMIVFIHGGAFCVRAERTDRRFCKAISDATGLPVVLVPYRLAPEHPFPCGLEDCSEVIERLCKGNSGANTVVLLGHSAGANLALSAMMRLRDSGSPLPAAAVLLSAPVDLTETGKLAASNLNEEDCMMDDAVWPWVARHYLADGESESPYASPILGSWRGFPPLSFHVSTSEVLFSDTLRAVEKAKAEGVTVEVATWKDMPHNFAFLDGLREAEDCHKQISAFVATALCVRSESGEA